MINYAPNIFRPQTFPITIVEAIDTFEGAVIEPCNPGQWA